MISFRIVCAAALLVTAIAFQSTTFRVADARGPRTAATTSTTFPLPFDPNCLVTVRLVTPGIYRSASVSLEYSASDSRLVEVGAKPDCRRADHVVSATFSADTVKKVVQATLELDQETPGPAGLFYCNFRSIDRFPTVNDYHSEVTAAQPVTAASPSNPSVQVVSVQCPTEFATTTTLKPRPGQCGRPLGNDVFTAGDARMLLLAAVGLLPCDLCVCDVDGSGHLSAADALIVLKAAVSANAPPIVKCPPCE